MRCLNEKTTQIIIAHQKERIDYWTKKAPLAAKNPFCAYFLKVDHPLKTQILIAWHLALGTW